jgi:DNA-binding transcriptional LysR family regulator
MKNDKTFVSTESMRLADLQLTIELLNETAELEHGARDRVAARRGIQKSVITDRVARMEKFFGVALFTGPQRKSPSAAGRQMAKYGPMFLKQLELFGRILQEAEEDELSPIDR